jgi:hypothetical protein
MNEEELNEWLQKVITALEHFTNTVQAVFEEVMEKLSELDWPLVDDGDEDGRN